MNGIRPVPKPRPREKVATQGLNRGKRLEKIGRRGKRLRAADRAQEKATKQFSCVCGCRAKWITRAHLIRRGYESTRNESWNNLPACMALHDWLDHTVEGGAAKAVLLEMAQASRERLAPEEVQPILRHFGYYGEEVAAGGC